MKYPHPTMCISGKSAHGVETGKRKNMKMVMYREEQILKALSLLNSIDVKGMENCQRLLKAFEIIQNPARTEEGKEEEDGTE